MFGKVAVFFCSWLLALSTALPLGIQSEATRVPRSGFATAKHALIIGCDGFGKFLIAQKIYTIWPLNCIEFKQARMQHP